MTQVAINTAAMTATRRRSPREGIAARFAGMGTRWLMVRVPSDLLAEIRAAAGARGVSAYVVDALRRQREHDHAAELVDWLEAEHGPLTDAEYAAGHRRLAEIDAEHARLCRDESAAW